MKGNYFRWNTIHVVPVEDTSSRYDTNFTSKAVNVIVGGGIDGSVSVKGVKQPTVFETSGRDLVTFEAGQGKMWLTRFGDDRVSRQLDGFFLHELDKLGFYSGVTCDSAPSVGASNRVRPRNFIHCCCEKGALLSRPCRRDRGLDTVVSESRINCEVLVARAW